jgi:hypothetical protein
LAETTKLDSRLSAAFCQRHLLKLKKIFPFCAIYGTVLHHGHLAVGFVRVCRVFFDSLKESGKSGDTLSEKFCF